MSTSPEPFEAVLERTAKQIDSASLNAVTDPLKLGRPSTYNEAIGIVICDLMAEGYSLRDIGEIPGMPSRGTIRLWLAKFPAFLELYQQAKKAYAESKVEEIIDIADSATADDVNVAKLKINSRQWLGSRLLPSRYGEKSTVAHVNAPESTNTNEICRRLAYLLASTPSEPKLIESTAEGTSTDD